MSDSIFKGKAGKVPKLVAVIHGLVAVTGLLILIVSVLSIYPISY